MMNYDRRKEKTKNAKHVLGRAAIDKQLPQLRKLQILRKRI